MQTPFGQECRYFYGDYYRGREFEECRALTSPEDKALWTSKLCKDCAMPGILRNNACQNMMLSASVKQGLWAKKIQVEAWCSYTHQAVADPIRGCGACHNH